VVIARETGIGDRRGGGKPWFARAGLKAVPIGTEPGKMEQNILAILEKYTTKELLRPTRTPGSVLDQEYAVINCFSKIICIFRKKG
jgi:hypothetical protein